MLARAQRYGVLLKQYGLRRCVFRFSHDLLRKHGLLKRKFPAWRWEDRPLSYWLGGDVPSEPDQFRAFRERSDVSFFFAAGKLPEVPSQWAQSAIEEADNFLAGKVKYFSWRWGEVNSPDIDFFTNPFTGQSDTPDRHWCDLADFDESRGDIKYLWEPSRFCWAYALSRAYAATGDEKYPEAFWRAFELWMDGNPPQMGINWQCGQEIAIRMMACVFAFHTFSKSTHTTDERIAKMICMLAGSAERITGNINYARAQMGNHATTEAAGLYTVGLLFPELKDADKWRKLGKYVLDDEAKQFCWPDGSYTQHSMNYQRLMLQDYLWCMQLGRINNDSLSQLTEQRICGSYKFLHQLQDETGCLPNYGPNDGALIIQLNGCDYVDYRPVIGAVHYLFEGKRLYKSGPWDEELLWLYGRDALESPSEPVERTSRDFDIGGYYTFRGDDSWAMIRCHSYANRPNQADILHFDLWWQGVNILRDSGSFTYFDPEQGWNLNFVSTAVHNAVVLGGVDQMIKGPRFRWFSLVQSKCDGRQMQDGLETWQGEHYGYNRLPSNATHRRTLCKVSENCWLIIDDIFGVGIENCELIWQLADGDYQIDGQGICLDTPAGKVSLQVKTSRSGASVSVEKGQEDDGRAGWESLYYGKRTPVPTMRIAIECELPLRFVTLVDLGGDWNIADTNISTEIILEASDGGRLQIQLLKPCCDGQVIQQVIKS